MKGNRFGRNSTDAHPPAELISGDEVEGANSNFWLVPLAGFVNPRYAADNILDDTGFRIDDCVALTISFDTGPTVSITIEQTLDPQGVAGWFPVMARRADVAATQSTTIGGLVQAAVVPVYGLRMRLRVTALTVADLKLRVAKLFSALDASAGSVNLQNTSEGSAPGSTSSTPIGLQAQTTQKTAQATGTKVNAQATADGKLIALPNAIPELRWAYAIASGGIITATAITIKAAAGASAKNFLTSLQLANDGATATEVELRAGAAGTVLWRYYLVPGRAVDVNLSELPPTAVNQLLELAVLTAGARIGGGFQGFTGV